MAPVSLLHIVCCVEYFYILMLPIWEEEVLVTLGVAVC